MEVHIAYRRKLEHAKIFFIISDLDINIQRMINGELKE
jgi:hypothetical protein